jgi:ABC-type transport system involved in cytochrome bd biosynthesis fused ATPase/permease subunit
VRLLLGLCRPDAGRISADGVDYASIAPESLHGAVSAVYQDSFRFSLTGRESGGVGRAACDDLATARAADEDPNKRGATAGAGRGRMAGRPAQATTPYGVVVRIPFA